MKMAILTMDFLQWPVHNYWQQYRYIWREGDYHMLLITDLGCDRHNLRQVTLSGVEADLMTDVLYNLSNDGEFHTYICECGHTHRISFNMQKEKLFRLSDMFSKKVRRSERQKPGPARANRGNVNNVMKG
jgi:hypothetical protein